MMRRLRSAAVIGMVITGSGYAAAHELGARQFADDRAEMCREANGRKAHPPKTGDFFIGRVLFKPSDIIAATTGVDQLIGEPIVILQFSQTGARRFADLTARKVGYPIPMFLNGRLLTCPVVNEPILGGEVQISGGLSNREARQMMQAINRYAG